MRRIVYWIMAIIAMGIVVLGVYCWITKPEFLNVNIFNILTMLWTVGLSFIVTQSFGKYQRKTDIMIKLLQELLDSISEEYTCHFNEKSKQEDILMRNRHIRQQIALLNEYSERFGIIDDIKFIDEKFHEYDEIIGDHISDIEYLAKSSLILERSIKLIHDRIYAVMLKI